MLDDIASVTLSTALSGLSARQRVSADNIANIETPNYRANQVSFEASLRDAVAAGDPSQATITTSPTGTPPAIGDNNVGVNGNNVSLDTETLTDEKTGLQYQLLSGALSSKFSLIESVLKG